jgi:MFS transporter, DHA1 family, tetracycline resistance protein
MWRKKEFLTIFIIMVTETLGFSLILPFLPFYAQELGATPITIGLILTSFSLFQFFSAPIMGRLSDIYGRKPLLMLSQFSTFLGFVILGFSNKLWLVFLSRIIDGALGSNFTIAQAYLSDISSKEDRSKAFGISGAAFGFGFLVGPALGGFLAGISFSLPAFIAAGTTLVTIATTHFILKESVNVDPSKKFSMADIKFLDTQTLKSIRGNKKVSAYFALFTTFVLSHSLFVSSYALFGERQLGYGVRETGIALTFVGLVNVIIRGFLLGKIIDRFGEERLQKAGIVFMVLCFGILTVVQSPWLFYLSIILFALGSGISRPVLMGEISRSVPAEKQGALMGLTNSIMSIVQIVAPLVGGYILHHFVPGYLPLSSLVILLVGVALVYGFNSKGMRVAPNRVRS